MTQENLDSNLNQRSGAVPAYTNFISKHIVGTPQGMVPQAAPEEADEAETDEEELPEADEQADEQAADDASSDSVFGQQFEQTFGIKPDEAVELVNSLQAFRDEQTLMRQWGVSPREYDERMTQVRSFYETLPDDGRQQFNTVEGANAIWEHLQKQGVGTPTTRASTGKSRSTARKRTKPAYDFKKSDIVRMSKDEYRQKLPAISKAFQTGRILEDI